MPEATEKKPKRVRPGAVAQVRPAVLREQDAAAFLGKSGSWMRQRRMRDIALARLGKAPEGPGWVSVENSILYRVADLDAWLASKAVERGQVEWRGNRVKAEALDGAPKTRTTRHECHEQACGGGSIPSAKPR